MRKITFFFTCATLFGQLSAQNPFKELGIKDSDYLTLSDGRYDEFYEYNDFERVGSAIIDMRTNKIARFIDRDSIIDVGMAELDMTTRFLTIDPLAEKYFQMSPYSYCANNPIKYIDPDGRSPIYAPDGTFLGTDDEGLQGVQLILGKSDFTQGMTHADAQKVLWTETISDDARAIMDEHVAGLSSRPDYDGIVSIAEGISWAKEHPGALNNPTADNTLYIDASKCDFGFLSTASFNVVGKIEPQNLFTNENLAAAAINPFVTATVYALGAVDMILLDRNQKTVQVVNNSATDYDWNTGGSKKRDAFIRTNNFLTNNNPQIHGFKTYYYGTGRLRK